VATTDAEGAYRQIVVTRRERRGDDARLLRRSFSFDRAFGPDASQAEVYAECGSLIRCVADGYNVCLLAYGQTGSGKTHTMSGPTNDFLNGFSFSDGDGDGDRLARSARWASTTARWTTCSGPRARATPSQRTS
jgi:hypothetical protein